MFRLSRSIPILVVAACVCTPLSAQEKRAELFVVARKTALMSYTTDSPSEVITLDPGDLLRLTPTDGTAAKHMRYVTVIDRRKTPLVGWVDVRRCHTFAGGVLPAPSEAISSDDYPPVLPALIRREPERVQQAYKDVEATIALNKKLKKELPEPYFLRAKLWTMVKNYDLALRDYVTASALVKDSKLDPVRYVTYFDGMTKLLDGLDRVPKAPDAGNATYHYNQGRSAFWAKDYAKAMLYFDDAISLDPTEPLYWYYRGMIFRNQGNERRAVHDIRLGANMERINRRQGRNSDYLLLALERVQGPMRLWLNKIRKGDHETR